MAALRRFTSVATLIVVCFIVAISSAAASTLISLDIEELAIAADEVVVASVLSSQAEPARGTIVTRYLIRVETSISGRATPTEELEIIAAGGELDGIGVLVHGAPRLTVDRRYLLFLSRHHSEHIIVGSAQGALPIRVDRSSGEHFVEPAENLPRLVRQEQGQLVSSQSALSGPTRLELLISRIQEARHGL